MTIFFWWCVPVTAFHIHSFSIQRHIILLSVRIAIFCLCDEFAAQLRIKKYSKVNNYCHKILRVVSVFSTSTQLLIDDSENVLGRPQGDAFNSILITLRWHIFLLDDITLPYPALIANPQSSKVGNITFFNANNA